MNLKSSAQLPDNLAIDATAPLDAIDIEILSAMLPSHPRAFWNGARADLLGGRPAAIQLAKLAGQDERLLRLSLLSIKSSRERRGFRAFEIARPLADAAMALPNKSSAWLSARLATLSPLLGEASIGHIFDLLGLAAQHGKISAFEEILVHCPDQKTSLGSPRLAPSRASHAWDGMGTPASRLRIFSLLASGRTDFLAEARQHSDFPSHPFFWCAARACHLRQSDSKESLRWSRAGSALLGRAPLPLGSPLDGAGWLLLNDPMREALSRLTQASTQAAESWERASASAISEFESIEQIQSNHLTSLVAIGAPEESLDSFHQKIPKASAARANRP